MSDAYVIDYLAVVIAIVVPIVFMGAALIVASFVAPRVRSEKLASTYECGMPPVGQFWSQVNIRYYLFAILFMIFDVEVVFLAPWALVLRDGGWPVFITMLVFVAILLFGLVYALRKGVLRWT